MTKQQRLVLVISILASAVGALDGFIVNVALPTISRELGGGLSLQQWTVDAYLLTLGSLILIAGSLSDLFGRKRILWAGLVWFGVTSLVCAVAPNGPFLIVGRILQGTAGALLMPSSLALIISAFDRRDAQNRAIGTWTAWFSVAAVAGPLLGGLIIAFTSWRWIFAINVLPITLTLWLMRRLNVPEHTRARAKVDLPGALACALGLAGVVFALIEQPAYGWSDRLIWMPLVLGLLLLWWFVWIESRTRAPMLPLSLFGARNFSIGNLATLAVYAGLSVSSFIITVTLQQVGGYSALQAGLAMLPVTVIMFTLSARFGTLAGRYGPRFFMAAGPIIAGCGFLLMLGMQPHVDYFHKLLPGVLVFGVGLSITVAPLTAAILGCIAPEHAGVASAVNNAVARVAGLIAVALIGLITGPRLDITGFHHTLIGIAILLFAGGLISAIGIENNPSERVALPKKQTDLV